MEVHVIDPGVIGGDSEVDLNKDLVGFSLRRDFSLGEKEMASVREQFEHALSQMSQTGQTTEIGAFMLVAFGRKPTGEVGGIVASGGSNITNLLMADFIESVYTAQLKANGMCRCPSCYARAMIMLKQYLQDMDQGSSDQVKH